MLASDTELVPLTSDGLAAPGLNLLPYLLLPLAGPEEFDLEARIIPLFSVIFSISSAPSSLFSGYGHAPPRTAIPPFNQST